MAQFAKQKGVKRLFLSCERQRRTTPHTPPTWDEQPSPWGSGSPAPLHSTRRRTTTIDSLDGIAATRADGVVLSAYPPPHTRALLRDLRAGLGPRVTLIGGEGFLDPTLFRAARACRPRDVHRLPRRGRLAPSPARKTVPEATQSPHRQAKRVLHRLRRPVSRDPARRDRPLRRHPRLSHQTAVQDETSRTASSETSASTKTVTRSKPPSPSIASSERPADRTDGSPTASSSPEQPHCPNRQTHRQQLMEGRACLGVRPSPAQVVQKTTDEWRLGPRCGARPLILWRVGGWPRGSSRPSGVCSDVMSGPCPEVSGWALA